MDIEHILKESELEKHIPFMGLTLQSGKDEFLHELLTKFSSNSLILENRAKRIHQLRNKNSSIDYTDCVESETILKEYKPTLESQTGEQQVFFQGEHTKVLNTIPYMVTIFVFLKLYVGPVLALLSPLFLFIMPWFILQYTMNIKMPWSVYLAMMKSMIFGIENSEPWGIRHYTQVLWTCLSIGQSVVQPLITAYHTHKTDVLIVKRGNALIHFVSRGKEILQELQMYDCMPKYICFPDIPSEVREAAAWIDSEPLGMKRIWQIWGQMDILCTLAKDLKWKEVQFNRDSLQLQNLSDLAISDKHAIRSELSLSSHSLLTGPNRGGKSSSLRAILQQVLLGQTFGLTYKTEGSWTPFRMIFTRLKSKDHAGKESLFEMEVRMASHILHSLEALTLYKANKDNKDNKNNKNYQTLVLIDELFHSTNPPDAETSARIFLHQLWKYSNAKSIISTHIFALCEEVQVEKGSVKTLCCPAKKMDNDSIQYSYKLESGIC